MSSEADLGGEAPCFAHLLPEPDQDLVTRSDIEWLVRDFYRDVAMDDRLGPIFSAARVDWSVHLPKVADFWEWQLFGASDYEGKPLVAHKPVDARTPFTEEHYERWLEIFDTTVDERFRGPNAEFAKRRARRMAQAMRRLLDGGESGGDSDSPPPKPGGMSIATKPTRRTPPARA
jgi:hemoglobin